MDSPPQLQEQQDGQLFGGKRFQVFVSSTFRDLIDARQQVIQALLSIDCFPIAMEYFPAHYDRQWEYIQPLIKSADYFICIVGGKYGSTDGEGISYTHREYLFALECGVPVAGFYHQEPRKLPADCVEDTDEGKRRLQEFINVVKNRLSKGWKSPEQLSGLVTATILQLSRKPRPGWVRGDSKSIEYLQLKVAHGDAERKISELQEQAARGPIKTYRDYDHAILDVEAAYTRAAKECEESGNVLKIRLMGVCLHKTFPTLRSFIEGNPYRIRIEIRMAIFDKQSVHFSQLDPRWKSLYETFESDLQELCATLEKNANHRNISIKMVRYNHLPNWHGVLINYQYLFLGHCLWNEDGRFTAGQNPYELFVRGTSGEHDYKLRHYIRWFDFCRSEDKREKTEMLLVDTLPSPSQVTTTLVELAEPPRSLLEPTPEPDHKKGRTTKRRPKARAVSKRRSPRRE